MNHAYYNANGTVVVSDENGNMRQVENWPDIDDILVQENVIEELERILSELIDNRAYYDNDTIFEHIPITSIVPLLCILIYNTGKIFLSSSGNYTEVEITKTATLLALLCSTGLTAAFLYGDILRHNRNKRLPRIKGGNECEIEFLESYLEEKRKTLAALKSKKSVTDIDSIEGVSTLVDDNEALEELKKLLDFSYNLGYNLDMYYQSYQDGTIKEKLQGDEYSDAMIRFAEKYLKEKGPVLVKERKQ